MKQTTFSERLYRILLHVYPRQFRLRFEDELVEAFRAERSATGGGMVRALVFWSRILFDTGRSAVRAWMRTPRRRHRHSGAVGRDVFYAARSVVKQPGHAVAIVATLALGIGATTAIYTVVHSVLLRPLPYADSERLVRLWDRHEQVPYFSVSPGNFFAWREQSRTLETIGAYREDGLNVVLDGEPVRLPGARVSADFLKVLGVTPAMGRSFVHEEDLPGGPDAVLLTHRLWMSRFAGRPEIVGKSVSVSGRPHTVIGVLPAGFVFPQQPHVELLVPYRLDPAVPARGAHFLRVLGRIRPDKTLEEARAELQSIAANLAREFPGSNRGWTVAVLPLLEATVHEVSEGLELLFAAVVCLLLIAGANVSNLMLARAHARTKEMALRAALGATRGRLVRQLLVESLGLAFAGGIAGIGIAWSALRSIHYILPTTLPRQGEIAVNAHVLGVALVVSVTAGLVFGVVPAFQGSKASLTRSFRMGGGNPRLRRLFVGSEVALAVTLLVASGLLLRTLGQLGRTELGFEPRNVLAMDITPVPSKYPEGPDRARFYRRVLERVEALPGVRHAAIVHRLPLAGNSAFGLHIEGRQSPDPVPGFNYRAVGGSYFDAMGMSLHRGRTFTDDETWEDGDVVVINEAMASALWPDEDPIGSRIGPSPEGPWTEVVGIVSNARESAIRDAPEPASYLPYVRVPIPGMVLVARTASGPEALTRPVVTAIRQVDPAQPVARTRTLEGHVSDVLGPPRFHALLITLFATLALLLAAVGIHGVVAHAVRQRRSEIGIRMALGARIRDVLALVARQGMVPVSLGLAAGLGGGYLTAGALSSQIYGISRLDPVSFFAFPLFLLVVALLAHLMPAATAAKIDPVETLRHE